MNIYMAFRIFINKALKQLDGSYKSSDDSQKKNKAALVNIFSPKGATNKQ
jgi:hypothetical protein